MSASAYQLAHIFTGSIGTQEAPARTDVDSICEEYIAAEAAAAAAYKRAWELDQPHERLKSEIILLTQDFGCGISDVHRTKLLRGTEYEVRVSHAYSGALDQEALKTFANKMRGSRVITGIFKDLFRWTISYELQPDADKVIKQFRLPRELETLYRECRKIESVPTLEVQSIAR